MEKLAFASSRRGQPGKGVATSLFFARGGTGNSHDVISSAGKGRIKDRAYVVDPRVIGEPRLFHSARLARALSATLSRRWP